MGLCAMSGCVSVNDCVLELGLALLALEAAVSFETCVKQLKSLNGMERCEMQRGSQQGD